jgi:membrane-associated phospholipid phosphatase
MVAGLILGPPAALGQDAPPASAASSPVRTFTKTIAGDLKSMVSANSVTVLSSAAAFALVAAPFDATLTYSASCSTFLKTTFDGWARLAGQEWLLAAGAAGTYAYGRFAGRPPVAQVGVDLMEAEIVAGLTTHVLKYATQRTRPDGEEFSFPSGHAAGTFAVATVLQRHYGLKAAIPAYMMATLISAARLQANAHYPTDIIMGSAFGILAGRAATMNLASHRVQLSPAAVRGGVMITGSIQ